MASSFERLKLGAGLVSQMLQARLLQQHKPILVALHVTRHCDLRCKHCYADMPSIRSSKDFSTREILEIIDEFYANGTRWMRLLGGEPLTRDDIGAIVGHAKKKGIICEVGTNGMLVKRKIEMIKKMNLDVLCVSLDGDRERNDQIRGEGTYDRIIEAIEVARQNDIRVRIHGTVVKKNLDCLKHFADLSLKYDAVFNCNTYLLPKDREEEEFRLSHTDITNLFLDTKELKDQGYPVMNSYLAINYVINWPLKETDILYRSETGKVSSQSYVPCQAGRLSYFMDADGSLYACPRKWKYGLNVLKDGVANCVDYLKSLDCVACRSIGCIESDLILSLNNKAVWNAFQVYSDTMLRKSRSVGAVKPRYAQK